MRLALLLLTFAAALASADPGTVSAVSANVRGGAGVNHPVVGTLKRGAPVEILETSGDWHRIRAEEGGLEGWVSARLVQKSASSSGAPARPAAAAEPTRAPAARLSIDHKKVGCLIADEFARIEACISPADAAARTQVHFRASNTSPWYSVDMRAEGSCLSAVLPKPAKTTKEVQYFIYSLDREFTEVAWPEGAPGASFQPKVVAAKGQCGGDGLLGSIGPGGVRQVVVSVARSPAGKILQGAASALGSPAEVAGFSAEGIVAGQPAAASGSASSSGATAAAGAAGAGVGAAAAGGGFPIAIAAGVGGAALVGTAVVVSGGGGDGAEDVNLSGNWTGTVASGKGMTITVSGLGVTCNIRDDFDMTITQNGSTLNASGTATVRSFNCSVPEIQPIISSVLGTTGSGTAAGTVSPPNAISMDFGEGLVMRGTYTANTIDLTGPYLGEEGVRADYILSVERRR